MRCPICKSKLVFWKQLELETLDEHVWCLPVVAKNAYICSNDDCIGSSKGVCWNDGGTFYDISLGAKDIKFINDNNGAFGSFQREINVSIYKMGVAKELFHIKLGKLSIHLEWNYDANEDGEVLSKRLSPKICYDCVLWHSPLSKAKFILRRHRRGLEPLPNRTWVHKVVNFVINISHIGRS